MFEESVRKLRLLIFIRALVVTLLPGSIYFFKVGYDKLYYPSAFHYFILSLYFLTLVYIIALRWIRDIPRYRTFAYAQIMIDVSAETVLVYLTGGIASWLSFMFPVSIISSAIMLDRRACYLMATFSSALYALVISLQFAGILPVTTKIVFAGKDYFYQIFANVALFYLIAFLSGYHTEKLRRTVKSLEEKSSVLQDLEVFSRDVVENMPSGVFTTDVHNRIIIFNSSAQAITGKTFSEVAGRAPEDIFPFLRNREEPRDRIDADLQCDGKIISIGMRCSKLKDRRGMTIGTIGVFQDLTRFKEMEGEVRKKEKWAFIGELSASIAHELRNPLASLKASVEMLRESRISSQHADHLLGIALSEMQRLDSIITDFLIYAKPQEPKIEWFDLHRLLRDAITLLRGSETDGKNVKITGDLPAELFIHGDPKQLQQVFWNLGINARDAISHEGEISISTIRRNNVVELFFKDSGTGIEHNDADKIFYPFFTTKESGTGLGLAIARKIVEAHGGRILAQNNTGEKGTTFRITLPQGTQRQDGKGMS